MGLLKKRHIESKTGITRTTTVQGKKINLDNRKWDELTIDRGNCAPKGILLPCYDGLSASKRRKL